MKKLSFAVILIIISTSTVNGADNYFHARHGIGENNFYEDYFILENNSLEKWAIGTKIVILDGLTILNPHVFWKFGSLQFGVKYSQNSLGGESAGPGVRFIKKTDWALILIDSAYYFDLNGGKNKFDTWLHMSTPNSGLYFGAEIWHHKFMGGKEFFHLRPIKIGYRAEKLPSPFLMVERKWTDWENPVDIFYIGLEMKF